MSRPKLIDFYCCLGGASRGYDLAGFDVYGVDLFKEFDRRGYPYPSAKGNAITILQHLVNNGAVAFTHKDGTVEWLCLDDVVAVVGSPPCQASSALTKGTNAGREYEQLIPKTRELFNLTGLPTVIENVQGSDLRRDLVLCGEMFGLGVIRHRYFEVSGFDVEQPAHVKHRGRVRGWRHGQYFDGPYVAVYGDGGGKGSVAEWQEAMGIDWTDHRKALAEAIPPAFTEYVGAQLMAHLQPTGPIVIHRSA